MGIDYGVVNHTKKQYLLLDRKFRMWRGLEGDYIADNWEGDQLEVGHDCGGLLSNLYEGPGGLGNYSLVTDEMLEVHWLKRHGWVWDEVKDRADRVAELEDRLTECLGRKTATPKPKEPKHECSDGSDPTKPECIHNYADRLPSPESYGIDLRPDHVKLAELREENRRLHEEILDGARLFP